MLYVGENLGIYVERPENCIFAAETLEEADKFINKSFLAIHGYNQFDITFHSDRGDIVIPIHNIDFRKFENHPLLSIIYDEFRKQYNRD